MDSNNIVTAPQISDVNSLYAVWRRDNLGSIGTFLKFMTTPSPTRDRFMDMIGSELVVTSGGVVCNNLKCETP